MRRYMVAGGSGWAGRLVAVLLALALWASPSAARRSLPCEPERWDNLTGSLGGLRTHLVRHGVEVDLYYTGEWFSNLHGGLSTRRATRYRGDLTLVAALDTAAAGWWPGGSIHVGLEHGHGRSLTALNVGDLQVLSNLDAPPRTWLSELWYEQSVGGGAWFGLGLTDANFDFGGTAYGCEFLNSAAAYPLNIPMVTYPDPNWGFVAGGQPASQWQVQAAVYDKRPAGGPLLLAQAEWGYGDERRPGYLRFGGWTDFNSYPGTDPVGSRVHPHNAGFYLNWEQLLWQPRRAEGCDGPGLGVFAQYGWAPPDRNPIEHAVGFGCRWAGPVPGRDDDLLGLGVFHAVLSRAAAYAKPAETGLETYYQLSLANWSTLTLDLQAIVHPGGTANRTAITAGSRLQVLF